VDSRLSHHCKEAVGTQSALGDYPRVFCDESSGACSVGSVSGAGAALGLATAMGERGAAGGGLAAMGERGAARGASQAGERGRRRDRDVGELLLWRCLSACSAYGC
jgi:hypothetical protein